MTLCMACGKAHAFKMDDYHRDLKTTDPMWLQVCIFNLTCEIDRLRERLDKLDSEYDL